MPCQRLPLVALLAAICGAATAACGGSSSESPPPLEPDPHGFHYAPAELVVQDADAGDSPSRSAAEEDDDKSRPKATSTAGDPGSKPQ